MLSLDSGRWSELRHAYGEASDTPDLLRQAEKLPDSEPERAEPYFSLWSSLCHQGDVYTASYAALPHLIRIVGENPKHFVWTLLGLVESIEVARLSDRGPQIPDDMSNAYFAALKRIPEIAAQLLLEPVAEIECRIILSACAISAGYARLADGITELNPDIVERLLDEWVFE